MVNYLGSLYAVALLKTSWISLAAASLINPPLHYLSLRDDSSCAANYTSCGSSYPSNFCCSPDTTCLGLDNYTSVLCCPTGSDCSFIVPITCNMQLQNATAYPTAPVKSTLLSDDPPPCGGGCCPFGYTCAKNSTCVLDVSSSSLANSSSSTSSASTAASTTVASSSGMTTTTTSPTTISIGESLPTTATAKATPEASGNSTQVETNATCQQYPAKAVIAGFFPGAIAGAMVAAIIVMCRRRSQQHSEKEINAQKTHRSSRGAIIGISDPIPDEDNGSFRTDFLLRRKFSGRYPTPGSVSRPKSRIRRTGTRVKSIFLGVNNSNTTTNNNNNALSPKWNDASAPPVPSIPAAHEAPVTPPQQTGRLGPRQPSTESIKVYSPPNILGSRGLDIIASDRNTTFSDVMKQAGFENAKGEPSYKVTKTPTL